MGCSLKTRSLTYHHVIAPRLLITLVVVVQFLFSVVSCSPVGQGHHLRHGGGGGGAAGHQQLDEEDPTGHVRVLKLYNYCTGHYVRMRHTHSTERNGIDGEEGEGAGQQSEGRRTRHGHRGKRGGKKEGKTIVDALGSEYDSGVHLRFVSIDFDGKVTIQSNETEEYLCFNKRGRLITKKNGRRKKMCHFTENYENNYTEIRLAGKPLYYLAFKPRGRPLMGYQWQEKSSWRRCRNFQHIGSVSTIEPHHKPNVYQPFDGLKLEAPGGGRTNT